LLSQAHQVILRLYEMRAHLFQMRSECFFIDELVIELHEIFLKFGSRVGHGVYSIFYLLYMRFVPYLFFPIFAVLVQVAKTLVSPSNIPIAKIEGTAKDLVPVKFYNNGTP
jgi:hypothetical protein